MDNSVEERRKINKVLVLLLDLSPKKFIKSKEFNRFCRFFDINPVWKVTIGESVKIVYKPAEIPEKNIEEFLFNLLLDFYKERPTEFGEFYSIFITTIANYNHVSINKPDMEESARKELLSFGFSYNEVYGIKYVDNQTQTITHKQNDESSTFESTTNSLSKKIFIVHGHDETLKEKVARFITNAGLNPIILHEQPNRGRSILQKLRDHSVKVGYVIVLFTPDDLGCTKDEYEKGQLPNLRSRARQNVIFELGFFLGLLNDKFVCVIHKSIDEIPTDYSGILYINCDDGNSWKTELLKELGDIGFEINYKNALK
jgi:predicted nucleotide-binding protein